MINSIRWRFKGLRDVLGIKGKFTVLIFYLMDFITLPLKKFVSFNSYRLFFLSDVIVKNKDGIYYCRKRRADFYHSNEYYEAEIRKYFKISNGIFVDGGAHIGRYTIMIARRLKNKGLVISIEPEGENFKGLIKNVRVNGLRNVIPLNLALYSRKTKIKLYENSFSVLRKDAVYGKGKRYQVVNSDTLDNIVKSLKINPRDIKLIKLDIEGAEADALKGASKLLGRYSPVIIFESNDYESFKRCKRVLVKYGYRLRRISWNYFLATK